MHEFGDELVRWVAGLAAASTELPRLVASSLVQRAAPSRYRLHELIKLHAAQQAANERDHRDEEVIARVVDFYVTHAGWADRAVIGKDRLRVERCDGVQRPHCGGYRPRHDQHGALCGDGHPPLRVGADRHPYVMARGRHAMTVTTTTHRAGQ